MKTCIFHSVKKGIKCILWLPVVALISCHTSRSENNPGHPEKIDEVVRSYVQNHDFSGAILVAKNGQIIYKEGFGLANREWDIPNTTQTGFRIASLTKQFTAMIAVQLAAEGKLDLQAPISNYIPEFHQENGKIITLHHLLTHTSGIPEVEFPDKEYGNYSPKELATIISEAPLDFTPGERFDYSNSGYLLIGYIIETITERRFEEVLKDKIITPLKMKNTGMDDSRQVIMNRASGYYRGGGHYWNAEDIDMSKVYTAGAMYTTVEDLYLWDRALYTEAVVPREYTELIGTKHIEDPTYGGHYGYGWELGPVFVGTTSERVETIRHDGVINGFCALITRVPSSGTCIIALSNTQRASLNAITSATLAILSDMTYDIPKQSIAIALSKKIKIHGADSLDIWLNEMGDSTKYYLDETEMNAAGYDLIQNENVQDAAHIFRLNAMKFPESFNVHDSYGEALMMMGDTTGAIRAYKKSLELNPDNENGAMMLRRLEN